MKSTSTQGGAVKLNKMVLCDLFWPLSPPKIKPIIKLFFPMSIIGLRARQSLN